ncbi:MAG: tetratricopeptide repeat protein [Deltaproteobacteria bacterium]|nr:tetratricopeptide repeat protein [Deltaproteobacteria bacterium]
MLRSRLTPRDLKRFAGVLADDLKAFFPDLEFVPADEPDPGALLNHPLERKGRDLGFLRVRPRKKEGREAGEEAGREAGKEAGDEADGRDAPPPDLSLLSALVPVLLEKLALKKALGLDGESGLANKAHFAQKLKRVLLSLEKGPRSLSLEEGAPPSLALGFVSFPGPWGPAAKALARDLSLVPGTLCLARLGDNRLGTLMRASSKDALSGLAAVRDGELARNPKSAVAIGFSVFPDDFAPDLLSGPGDPSLPEALGEMAAAALSFSDASPLPRPVLAFRDLVANRGKITQVLPQERAVINLGRSAGARAGQIFTVPDDRGEPKGEAAVFETAPGYSLVHTLVSPGKTFAEGDRLEYSRTDDSAASPGFDPARFSRGDPPETGPEFPVSPDKPFLFALARLDDREKLLRAAGELQVEKRLSLFRETLANDFPFPPDSARPFGPGTLSLVWNDPGEELVPALRDLLATHKGPGKMSLGLVFWPSPVLARDDVVSAAREALLESSMTGPGELSVFGPQTLNIRGDRLFDEGDLAGAVREYGKGLMLDPAHLNLLNSLGVCHGRRGDQKAAMAAFDDVLRLDPENLMATFNKGCSMVLAGRPEEAEKAFEKAAALDPDNFEILFQLGKTSLELGRAEAALDALNRANGLKGKRGVLHAHLGRARLLAGDGPGAMLAFKQAVKFNPDDAQSLSSLGVLYKELGADNRMALSLFRKSVELDPSNSLFRKRLGSLLFELGQYPDAERHLRRALEYSNKTAAAEGDLKGLDLLASEIKKTENLPPPKTGASES